MAYETIPSANDVALSFQEQARRTEDQHQSAALYMAASLVGYAANASAEASDTDRAVYHQNEGVRRITNNEVDVDGEQVRVWNRLDDDSAASAVDEREFVGPVFHLGEEMPLYTGFNPNDVMDALHGAALDENRVREENHAKRVSSFGYRFTQLFRGLVSTS